MAIFRTDRDRRILGDRVVAREAEFHGVDEAVGRVFERFHVAHDALQRVIEERTREEGEDAGAALTRERALEEAGRMYAWAYGQVENLVAPDWRAAAPVEDVTVIRERLFPFGPPGDAARRPQIALDSLTHLLAALDTAPGVAYPDAFVDEAKAARSRLAECIDEVARDRGETREAIARHKEARERWDRVYRALRDVTRGFLGLDGHDERFPALFQPLPQPPAPSTTSPLP